MAHHEENLDFLKNEFKKEVKKHVELKFDELVAHGLNVHREYEVFFDFSIFTFACDEEI